VETSNGNTMKKLLIILSLTAVCCAPHAAARDRGQAVIFETDMGNDIDDALALDLLFKNMDRGAINLLGISVHKNNPHAAEFIDIMRRWYGYARVPIGVNTRCVTDTECVDYATAVCRMTDAGGRPLFARSGKPKYEEAVDMYRRLLAAQPDNSVAIVSVGFSTTIADLLRSGADRHSELQGRELVARKVKYFSVMAGEFQMKDYAEYNVWNDIPSARYFFDESPVPIIITPFTIGMQIRYPGRSIGEDFEWGRPHPMVEAYKAYAEMPYDRPAWDVIAAYYACDHDPDAFTLSDPCEVRIDDKGVMVRTPDPEGRFRIMEADPAQRKKILDRFVSELTTKPRRMKRAAESRGK